MLLIPGAGAYGKQEFRVVEVPVVCKRMSSIALFKKYIFAEWES